MGHYYLGECGHLPPLNRVTMTVFQEARPRGYGIWLSIRNFGSWIRNMALDPEYPNSSPNSCLLQVRPLVRRWGGGWWRGYNQGMWPKSSKSVEICIKSEYQKFSEDLPLLKKLELCVFWKLKSLKARFISTQKCLLPHPTRWSIHPTIHPLIAPQCYIHLRWSFFFAK